MSTLDELVHYCNETNPIGALMLTGEWGCGKTYLIESALTDALKDTHIIVRVSLFGVNSAKMLQDSIRQKWFDACLPILGALQKAKGRSGGFLAAFNAALKSVNPWAGNAANVMISMNALDFMPIRPEVEDFKTQEKKRVVLVYDDLERVRMDQVELLGIINDYCENQHFNTIILANEESLKQAMEMNITSYLMLKEKTISRSICYVPDYAAIVHSIITEREWPTPEYAEYLAAHENLILDAFASDLDETQESLLPQKDGKYHNLRSLMNGMKSFYRIYYWMENAGMEIPDSCLYSFLAYYLTSRSGIRRDGKPTLEFDDHDIKQFYPGFSPDAVTEAERIWISAGIWDGDRFLEEIAAVLC
ncbi:MAG: hypothetical protein IKT07_07075 [Oscillospiraceae bacterium]|nr:hypothetical protein [Oscillospiraceae bacterium]